MSDWVFEKKEIKSTRYYFNRVAERRCDGLVVFVKEENKKLGGPFEVDVFTNMTLEECQSMCLRAEK